MKILQDLSYSELCALIKDLGEKPFRATQIYTALASGLNISQISNISNALKQKLLSEYEDCAVKLEQKLVSVDGTEKYLFLLNDGNILPSHEYLML